MAVLAWAPALALAAPSPQGTYTDHVWPGGHYNVDSFLTVEASSPGYFWAHQFSLKDASGGYVGLQDDGYFFDGTRGKLAIFSIWNAGAASGPSCQAFSNEGQGYSCRIPYAWTPGHKYRLRVWATSSAASGRWWSAWVMDLSTGEESFIGQILAGGTGWLDTWSVNFTEYFGPALTSCAAQPYARARWSEPGADNATVNPKSSTSRVSTSAGCANGAVSSSGPDELHEMGVGGTCQPDCVGKCGGALDGCGGLCAAPCGVSESSDAGAPGGDGGCLRPPCQKQDHAGAETDAGPLPPLYDPGAGGGTDAGEGGCAYVEASPAPALGAGGLMLLFALALGCLRRRGR